MTLPEDHNLAALLTILVGWSALLVTVAAVMAATWAWCTLLDWWERRRG